MAVKPEQLQLGDSKADKRSETNASTYTLYTVSLNEKTNETKICKTLVYIEYSNIKYDSEPRNPILETLIYYNTSITEATKLKYINLVTRHNWCYV